MLARPDRLRQKRVMLHRNKAPERPGPGGRGIEEKAHGR